MKASYRWLKELSGVDASLDGLDHAVGERIFVDVLGAAVDAGGGDGVDLPASAAELEQTGAAGSDVEPDGGEATMDESSEHRASSTPARSGPRSVRAVAPAGAGGSASRPGPRDPVRRPAGCG